MPQDYAIRVYICSVKTSRAILDSDLFRKLAAHDEVRARSAAESFKDRLRRIDALAAIYQSKARQLDQRGDTSRRK